jgi:hypothetical protein
MTTGLDHTITIDDLVPLYEPPSSDLPRREAPGRLVLNDYTPTRRGVLRIILGTGTAAGLTMLGVFPGAKRAAAACVGSLNSTISGPCPVNVGDCSPACGPSAVNQSACNSDGWHMWTGNYRNRPNSCNNVAGADGWNWYGIGCSCPSGCARAYRCHDGCSLLGGTWTNTICRRAATGCVC